MTLGSTVTLDTTNNGGSATGAALNVAGITGGSNALTLHTGTSGAITVNGAVAGVTTLDITNSNGATFQSSIVRDRLDDSVMHLVSSGGDTISAMQAAPAPAP